MITEEDLAQQFSVIIEHTHPRVWKLLRQCYVKIINPSLKRSRICHPQYVGIYCPDRIIATVSAQKNLLREVAQYLGLVEVVCLNATNLVRDPMSQCKQSHPHLWLDLLWILTQE